MNETAYGASVVTTLDMEQAEDAIRLALAEQGFGVLTEIDVAATLKMKLDVDRAPYKILGACNPHLAHQAIEHDEKIGLLLPCNVTLAMTDEGTEVSVIDPEVMLSVAGQAPEMMALASEARTRLRTALASIS